MVADTTIADDVARDADLPLDSIPENVRRSNPLRGRISRYTGEEGKMRGSRGGCERRVREERLRGVELPRARVAPGSLYAFCLRVPTALSTGGSSIHLGSEIAQSGDAFVGSGRRRPRVPPAASVAPIVTSASATVGLSRPVSERTAPLTGRASKPLYSERGYVRPTRWSAGTSGHLFGAAPQVGM